MCGTPEMNADGSAIGGPNIIRDPWRRLATLLVVPPKLAPAAHDLAAGCSPTMCRCGGAAKGVTTGHCGDGHHRLAGACVLSDGHGVEAPAVVDSVHLAVVESNVPFH